MSEGFELTNLPVQYLVLGFALEADCWQIGDKTGGAYDTLPVILNSLGMQGWQLVASSDSDGRIVQIIFSKLRVPEQAITRTDTPRPFLGSNATPVTAPIATGKTPEEAQRMVMEPWQRHDDGDPF